jgi:hypothetical protein
METFESFHIQYNGFVSFYTIKPGASPPGPLMLTGPPVEVYTGDATSPADPGVLTMLPAFDGMNLLRPISLLKINRGY